MKRLDSIRNGSRHTLPAIVTALLALAACGGEKPDEMETQQPQGPAKLNVHQSVVTPAVSSPAKPVVDAGAFWHASSTIIGAVNAAKGVFIGPNTVLRADTGGAITIGEGAGVLDGAVLHGAITIGNGAIIGAGARADGASTIGAGAMVGPGAIVSNGNVGDGAVLGARAVVAGVSVPAGKYVAPGRTVADDKAAAGLPDVASQAGLADEVALAGKLTATWAAAYKSKFGASNPGSVSANPATEFMTREALPKSAGSAFIHSRAVLIGDVEVGEMVSFGAGSVVRADEGHPFYFGHESALQEGAIVTARMTHDGAGKAVPGRLFDRDGKHAEVGYAIYFGNRAIAGPHAVLRGPVYLGDGAYVGAGAAVDNASLGRGVIVEPGAVVAGVEVPAGKLVPAGAVVTSDAAVQKLKDAANTPWDEIASREATWQKSLGKAYRAAKADQSKEYIQQNVVTDDMPWTQTPAVGAAGYVHHRAVALGHVRVDDNAFLAPGAMAIGEEGIALRFADGAAVLDGVTVRALETEAKGEAIDGRTFNPEGERGKGKPFAVYVGAKAVVAPGAALQGPLYVGDGSYVGAGAVLVNAKLGAGCVVEPGAVVVGAELAPGSYVPAGTAVHAQAIADILPMVSANKNYAFAGRAADLAGSEGALGAAYHALFK